MKSIQHSPRQLGFFDLGMSFLVLALAGGVIYGAESLRAEQQSLAAVQAEQLAAKAESANDETVVAEAQQ